MQTRNFEINGCTLCRDSTKLNFLFSVRRSNYSNSSLPWLGNLIFLFLKIPTFRREGCWEGFTPSLPVTGLFPVHCPLSTDQWSTPVCRNTPLKSKMTWFPHLSWPMLAFFAKQLYRKNWPILHIFTNSQHSLCRYCCNYHSVGENNQPLNLLLRRIYFKEQQKTLL